MTRLERARYLAIGAAQAPFTIRQDYMATSTAAQWAYAYVEVPTWEALRMAASLALDGSPGGRWPRPRRRRGK